MEELKWKDAELRGRIGDLEARIKAAGGAPRAYLRRRDLKDGFCLMISEDQEHFHAIRDAEEMAAAAAAREWRLMNRELATLRRDKALVERMIKQYKDDDLLTLISQLPKAYRELPCMPGGQAGGGAKNGELAGVGNTGGAGILLPENADGGVAGRIGNASNMEALDVPESELDDRAWVAANNRRNRSKPEHLNVTTSFGLIVRSKSEMLIAEHLHHSGLPFRYEPEIRLMDGSDVYFWYPDYEIRLTPTRSIFWEHHGLMDNSKYRARKLDRMRICFENGIHLGRDMIVTMEDSTHPLDVNDVIEHVNMLLNLAHKCR